MNRLDRIQVKGFKSIREMDLELRPINVLIGANGSGKSNFLSMLHFLNQISESEMQRFIARSGGANSLLHWRGGLRGNELYVQARFEQFGYEARFTPTGDDSLVFVDERVDDERVGETGFAFRKPLDGLDAGFSGETRLHFNINRYKGQIAKSVLDSFKDFKVYHFNNTGDFAPVKLTANINDTASLKADAANLAAVLFLFSISYDAAYRRIVETIQLAAPFFKDFDLRPKPDNPNSILLGWRQRGSETYFNATALSDGMLRFICLTTLLMQPTPPLVIIIDEPELGLHPYAETLVASMVKSIAAKGHQIILATHSTRIISEFSPEDLVVVENEDNASVFKRKTTKELEDWLEDYSLGEIWEKNIIGGTP